MTLEHLKQIAKAKYEFLSAGSMKKSTQVLRDLGMLGHDLFLEVENLEAEHRQTLQQVLEWIEAEYEADPAPAADR